MTGKGILLYSGGLDSLLAGKLLIDQGIDLIGLHFLLPFVDPDADHDELPASRYARQINLAVVHERLGEDYLAMVKNPPHGYGKNMNPCLDCKVFFLKKAAEFMKKTGADFVATGEVIGQRPMSQLKNSLNHLMRASGLEGHLLRPLSAKIMKPTIAEEQGLVNRELLLGLNGRGRKTQLELAHQWGITDFTSPAGGCLFTDPHVAVRIRDIFRYVADLNQVDFFLLGFGRHFRIHDNLKIIVSRNETETRALERVSVRADYFVRPSFIGPAGFARGSASGNDLLIMARLVASYGKITEVEKDCVITDSHGNETILTTEPLSADEINSYRLK